MIQHVISEWLLRAFARTGPDGPALTQYDKATDTFEETSPGGFLVEHDAHPVVIEHALQAIETPAAQAGRRLAKLFRHLPPGMYAMIDEGGAAVANGEEMRAVGTIEGTSLVLAGYHASWPMRADRRSLASYVGLMYQRSPKVEEAIRQWGLAFDKAAQRVLHQMMPGMRTGLEVFGRTARARMIERTQTIGSQLEAANWFVVRSPDDESFVLSDCPVTATIALGHDDSWRAIFADEAYVVVMPIGPKIALVVAPALVPMSGIETRDLTKTINRLVWRSAGRYVLGRERKVLESALPNHAARRITVAVERDPNADANATAILMAILQQVMRQRFARFQQEEATSWIHWDRCRLVVGHDLRLPPIGQI